MDAYPTTVDDRMGIRAYVRALRRRWAVVAISVLIAVGAATTYSLLQQPIYSATAGVLIEPLATNPAGVAEITDEELDTQVEVISSQPVARRVQDDIGSDQLPDLANLVTVEAVGTSRVVTITAADPSPEQAATLANSVAQAYLAYRAEESERASEKLAGQGVDGPAPSISLGSGGQLAREAEAPGKPSSPRPFFNGLLAAVLGLMLGGSLVLLCDRFDDTIHDEEAVRVGLGELPVVGRLPRGEPFEPDRLISLEEPYSPSAEAFQILATNLRFALSTRTGGRRGGVVLVSSAQSGEGRTTTACNVAVAAARLGMRVALVDTDLRRSAVAERFRGVGGPGLSDLLLGREAPGDCQVDAGVPNLTVLSAGAVHPSPTELLGSKRFAVLMERLVEHHDMVVLDSPPLLAVADGLQLTELADLVLVVTRLGGSRQRQSRAALQALRQVGVSSVVAAVNGVADRDGLTRTGRPGSGYAPRQLEVARR